MTTLLITHPACLDHLTPPGHPERPDRLRAIDARARAGALPDARARARRRPRRSRPSRSAIRWTTSTAIRDATPKQGLVRLDADTSMSPGSFEAALRAVGGAVHAVDEVIGKQGRQCLRRHAPARPPRRDRAADGLLPVQQRRRSPRATRRRSTALERVAIVDFDVHHGNGTQDIFWSDPTVMYCSTHQMPLYPGTGAASERGEHDTIVNAPLRAGDGGERVPRGVREPRSCRGCATSGRTWSSSRPASTPTCATRSPTSTWSRPISPGSTQQADGDRRRERAGPRRLGAGRRLRPARALPSSVAAHVTALMRG